MATESDRLLVADIRQGGVSARSAWEQLVARYEGRLRAYVKRRLRDQDAGDDVVQETFIGFLTSLPHFDDKRDLQTWLFTIAAHKVTDQLRKMGRRPTASGSEAEGEIVDQTPDTRRKGASSRARSKERRELEQDAIARSLGALLRGYETKGDYDRIQVLELLFVKGWANRRAAEFIGVSEQQVANFRFAAVKRLTEAMTAAGLPVDVFPELKEST